MPTICWIKAPQRQRKLKLPQPLSFGAILASIYKDMATVSLRSLSDPSYLQPALQTWLMTLHDPVFPTQAFGVIKQRMQWLARKHKEVPNQMAWLQFNASVYANHAYAHPAYALSQPIAPKTLKQFYQDHYHARACHLIIVGDLTIAEAKDISQRVAQALHQRLSLKHCPPSPMSKVKAST